jgi:prepilin-type N-terminal cleavage/methylation domain-containing protein
MKQRGFTFIELIMGVGVLALMATVGAAIFLRALRGTSGIEVRRSLDDRARLVLDGLGRFFREGQFVSLSGQTRSDCLTAGSLNGDSLVVKALDGLDSTFSVSAGQLSSASAQTVILNPESVTLSYKTGLTYYFVWYCLRGVPDRVVMEFKATSTGTGGDTTLSNQYILDVISRNSSQ